MLTRADLVAIRAIIREEVAAATRSGGPSETGIGALVAPPRFVLPPVAIEGAHIYFLRCETDAAPIKIGRARDLAHRLDSLRVGSPHELALLGWYWTRDPVGEEERLHRRFAAMRIRGEWFAPNDELLAVVADVAHLRRNALVDVLLARAEPT